MFGIWKNLQYKKLQVKLFTADGFPPVSLVSEEQPKAFRCGKRGKTPAPNKSAAPLFLKLAFVFSKTNDKSQKLHQLKI